MSHKPDTWNAYCVILRSRATKNLAWRGRPVSLSPIGADEPTGNLDSGIGQVVLQALLDARTSTGTTLVLVTHDSEVAVLADRSVTMKDGMLVDQT